LYREWRNVQGFAQLVLPTAAVVARADVYLAILKVPDVDVNARDEKGEALLFICLSDRARLQGVLGHAGLRINECDRHGNSALMATVKRKNAAAVQVLADRGIDLHLKNKGGKTAWDLAGDGITGPPVDGFEFVQKLISIIQKPKIWSSHS
jgi:ankyrin repeat protein